ncbi:MAG: tRNA (adenosine(37)-N6)-threonylcarbamoyltransferase complex dimerization subunit type 1 TsaB [Porticoccaceae bacterium]|nr:tRNA (adenosine(37)-N6)-threonylcarbamoyltransferase complex dimerization subunit type 1 TsaB [Porticoccaceae bacterium]
MACILNLETSTTNCSVALSLDGELLLLKEDNSAQYSHSERLHLYIDTVLKETQIERSQIDAVAVSKGPGSYTGLRIGVSAAKGLCFGLDIPLIALPTLEVLANKIQTEAGCIVATLDARRMEVYSAVFDTNHQCIDPTTAKILNAESYADLLEKHAVFFVGNGAAKTQDLIDHPNAHFDDQLPSSKEMCALSYQKYKAEDFEDLAYFEPFYLKDFIAFPSKKN